MKKTKYLIIGAGISGLTLANYIDNEDYLIIEKEDEIGGLCRTFRQDGYIWDYAGHFFHFKTEEMKKMFRDKMKDEKIIYQAKNTKIYYKGKLIDYPFQTNIHQLEKDEFIDCLYDLYNKEEKENYDNFLDMLYGKFGKSITEKFLKPYNEKLYACDLTMLDKDAMGRFFPYADINQIINNMKESTNSSYNNTFLYPKRGAVAFLEKLYESLDKEKVLLNTEIKSIDINNKSVSLSNGDTIEYDYIVNTSPFNNLLKLLGEDYVQTSDELSFNQVLVFNLGFEKAPKNKEHWLYFPDKSLNFYRVGFYNNILNEEKMSLYVEIGFSKGQTFDIDEQLKLTLENLEKVGIIEDNKLVSYNSLVMNPAYVHINTEHMKKIDELKSKFEDNNLYTIGRYGDWTYCSMEDCMISAKNLAEKIRGKEEK